MLFKEIKKIEVNVKNISSLPVILSEMHFEFNKHLNYIYRTKNFRNLFYLFLAFLFTINFLRLIYLIEDNGFLAVFISSSLPLLLSQFIYNHLERKSYIKEHLLYSKKMNEIINKIEINVRNNSVNYRDYITKHLSVYYNSNRNTIPLDPRIIDRIVKIYEKYLK